MVMVTGHSSITEDPGDELCGARSSSPAVILEEDASRLTEVERRQLLAWNATERDYSRNLCVPELVAHQAAIAPCAPAVASWDQALSYAELNRRANQLAHHLRHLHVGPDVPVGV